MIVRISTEGQYQLDDGHTDEVNRLDNEVVAACEAENEARFHEIYARLLEVVRSKGQRLDDQALTSSDLILPPPDVSLEEAKSEFSGEGLLPG